MRFGVWRTEADFSSGAAPLLKRYALESLVDDALATIRRKDKTHMVAAREDASAPLGWVSLGSITCGCDRFCEGALGTVEQLPEEPEVRRPIRLPQRDLPADAEKGSATQRSLEKNSADEKSADTETGTGNHRPVPTFGRGTCLYRGVLEGDPVSGEDHKLSVYAQYGEDGFELTSHDGGHYPVDEYHSALWVEPEHVEDLLSALGGTSGDDPVVLLRQRIQDGDIQVKTATSIERVCISDWFQAHGVRYTSAYTTISNL